MKKYLINTDDIERRWMKGFQQISGMPNMDIMVAKALEQYLTFHKHVEGGAEIIVRTHHVGGGRGRFNVFVPLKWEDSSGKEVDQNVLTQKMNDERVGHEVLQIMFDDNLFNRLEQFVSNGYAPSITSLISGALQTFAGILPVLKYERGHVYAKTGDTEIQLI